MIRSCLIGLALALAQPAAAEEGWQGLARQAQGSFPAPMSCLWTKPMVAGASVSADYRAPSPGRVLARRFAAADRLTVVARPGARSAQIVPRLEASGAAAASILVALDLFFWDSTDPSCSGGLAAVKALFAQPRSGVLVVGNVPDLGRGQSCRAALNAELSRACGADPRCVLFDLDALVARLRQQGGLDFDGRFYAFRDLTPDGLHLTATGSDLIAQLVLGQLQARPELCPAKASS